MKVCDICKKAFEPTHGRQKRHVECRRRANSEAKKAAYRTAHPFFTPRIIEPLDVSTAPDDIVRHPWSMDGLGMPAGTPLYITRAKYESLTDKRSVCVRGVCGAIRERQGEYTV